MADSLIEQYLNKILEAVYGKDVRQAIHDGIQQCYYDGKAGSIDLEARQQIKDNDNRRCKPFSCICFLGDVFFPGKNYPCSRY